ncbi:hypothetical protein B0H16DRAFT_1699865 [Mycena metata]|uniref:F-box domain-containing protein n=1 Tax=Mycena metata TaxID=1033252 RepID=A0AAD7HHD9_9AGAR|nr:hypothetical protein B0H16DRAFT_1699865 [Mycena metata]
MPFEFVDLVEDLILLVMCDYCDIKSVVRIGQTSKYLHRLAFSHDVWFSRRPTRSTTHYRSPTGGRESRDSLDGSAHQGSKTNRVRTDDVVASSSEYYRQDSGSSQVQTSGTTGFFATTAHLSSESRRVVLHPQIAGQRAELLPGGEHLLLQAAGRLECRRISGDKLIWAHVTCQSISNELWKRFIEITILDLNSGNSRLVLVVRVPDKMWAEARYNNCTVCGNMAAVVYDSIRILLINWIEHSYVVVETFTRELNSVVFIPRYIVLKLRQTITACALASFDKLWVPVDGINMVSNYTSLWHSAIRIKLDDIPIQPRGAISSGKNLWVYKSPTEHGMFRLWAHLNRDMAGLRSNPLCVLYSGNFLTGNTLGSQDVLPPVQGNTAKIITLNLAGRAFHVSPYSGTVTCGTEEGEVILTSYD